MTARGRDGRAHEEAFPLRAYDDATAIHLAVAYILRVFKVTDFELRLVGG